MYCKHKEENKYDTSIKLRVNKIGNVVECGLKNLGWRILSVILIRHTKGKCMKRKMIFNIDKKSKWKLCYYKSVKNKRSIFIWKCWNYNLLSTFINVIHARDHFLTFLSINSNLCHAIPHVRCFPFFLI